MALMTIRSRASWNVRNLPRRVTDSHALADQRRGLGRRAPHHQGLAHVRASTGRPTRVAWKASARMARSGNSGTAVASVTPVVDATSYRSTNDGTLEARGTMRGP